MKKFITYSFLLPVIVGAACYKFGLYPVASVNGTLIFARAWQRTLDAEKQVVNVRAHTTHARLIDFSSARDRELLETIRRSTLTFLIDSILIKQEGLTVVRDIEQLSVQRVNDELRKSQVTESMAAAVYGLDLAALKETILLPQARQEILSDTLAIEHKDFSDWLINLRTRAKIKFFFVPFQWDQEGVK
jgi:hypothetical protein